MIRQLRAEGSKVIKFIKLIKYQASMGSITLEDTQIVVILVAFFCLYRQCYVQAISQIASKIDCLPTNVRKHYLDGNTLKAVKMSLKERCGGSFI